MERIVRKYLRKQRLLEPGQRVLVALSGGADSTALLLCLRALGYDVAAAHLNHGLRGAEGDRDEQFVHSLCARLGVPLYAGSADVIGYAREAGVGTEEAARVLRYRFLEACADKASADRIATAHTADDNLETVLFHLARGSGTRGMAGIPPVRGRIIRPLLPVTRAEVEAYLREKGQDYVTDSSNLSSAYTRNRVRHEVVPALREIFPYAARSAERMSAQARADADCLDELAAGYRKAHVRVNGAEALLFRSGLCGLHGALRSRVLRQTLDALGLSLSEVGERHIDALDRLLFRDGETDLPGGWTACAESGTVRIARRTPDWGPVPAGFGAQQLPNGTILCVKACSEGRVINNPFNSFRVSRDKIDLASLSVCRARAADRLELSGHRGARTVRRLCDDCRVPRALRRDLAALRDKNGLIAVERIGLDRSREGDGSEKIEISFGGQNDEK